ncbi:bifunctional glutamate N-acetyltransferase/amino-acid acetyltransferase ArgJ [Nostocoides sp.]|uniref:bifunctional glutamate N-acetyltransferase/amino-acid acetyltransferase ArgJ n=1 Tax=Nostocoides sp. TaxID=1917966 RepID=UPI002BC78314|nr:bifunctional glutamate N-acetyltransferase/amino-acid acetyltransferase ArgJ [Tetrasphaera sp.]
MSVTSPLGFRASGVTAGLKASGRPDVALVVNDGPEHTAAAVLTTNRVQAAPVRWTRQVAADGRIDAVILNSGGANACTGPQGFQDTHRTAEYVAQLLGISAADVAVCSTGLIGELLPMPTLLAGCESAAAALSDDGGSAAATAIMTTDTVAKTATYDGEGWSVGGMAKGAGMLAPGLATMLVVLTTDALVEPGDLAGVLRGATSKTFDRVDSDGCMSTNDTVLALASGASGLRVPVPDLEVAVTEVCADLALQLVRDAEGAAHEVRIDVIRAASEADGLSVGRAVARSNLVKCAIFGNDPNWGRILAAVGTTDAAFDGDDLDVTINGIPVCRGSALGADRDLVDLSAREAHILIDLKVGTEAVTVWTNDLTHDYVHENSAYST